MCATALGEEVDRVYAIRTEVRNVGAGAARMNRLPSLSAGVVLDEDGLPLSWGYLDDTVQPSDGVLGPDRDGWIEDDLVSVGCGQGLRVFIAFGGEEAASPVPPRARAEMHPLARVERDARLLRERNRRARSRSLEVTLSRTP